MQHSHAGFDINFLTNLSIRASAILILLARNFKLLARILKWHIQHVSVLAVDDRHVAFCEYNGSVARIICVAVATLANKKLLERVSDNDLLLCRKSTSNKTRYRQ